MAKNRAPPAAVLGSLPHRSQTRVDDISLILQYHPEVRKVDLLSGRSTRAIGVKYRCTIPEGRRGSCIEEVVDYVPGQRMATAFPEDTWGISKMFADFVVDANFDDRNPKWSPDGLTIGFGRKEVNDTDVKTSLWLMSADGANPQPVHPGVRNFRWMPDSQRILYHSTVDRQLYLLDIRAKSAQRLTDEAGITGIFTVSPDGQWVVYQSTLKGLTIDVRAVKTSGGASQGVAESPHMEGHPVVSPSGKWLYYQRDHKNLFRVPGPAQGWRQAEPEKVTNFPESGLFLEDPQISRDGRQLFYLRARITGDIWVMSFGK